MVWFFVGIIVYAIYGFRNSRLRGARPKRRFAPPHGMKPGVTIRTAVSDRFELITVPRSRGVPSFAQDVAQRARLQSETIYRRSISTTRSGRRSSTRSRDCPNIISPRRNARFSREWGWQIVRLLDAPVDFLELGSGSAVKTRLLIGEALRVQTELCYSPIDISTEALRASSLALVEAYPGFASARVCRRLLRRSRIARHSFRAQDTRDAHGLEIGNYEPARLSQLLRLLGRGMRPGDGLLLGADLKKDRATLELAYDDPTGVTAAFDRNVLARVNRELERTSTSQLCARRRYDEARGSVDSFLEAREAAVVPVGALGLPNPFARANGFTPNRRISSPTTNRANRASGRFSAGSAWHDRANRFSVHLLIRE